MYEAIAERRSVRKIYTETLVNRGDLTVDACEAMLEDYRAKLEHAFEETHDNSPQRNEWDEAEPEHRRVAPAVDTGVARDRLDRIVTALTTFPDGFTVHPKLARILGGRRAGFDSDKIDWATAEALAFGSLVLEGTPVRVAGQDTRRGTFSQRHATLVDFHTEDEYTPLAHLDDAQAPFMIYDSVLSEYAALGFEYGYSVADREALVCWEAQFGDFANVGQSDHRPVRRGRRGQVGPAQRARAAPAARLRGPGPRTFERTHRTVPRAVRRGQHSRRLPVDGRELLPSPAPPGASRRAQAARGVHAEALPPRAGHLLACRGVHERGLPEAHRRCRHARAVGGQAPGRVHGQDRARARRRAATRPARPPRSCASSSSTRFRSRSCRRRCCTSPRWSR